MMRLTITLCPRIQKKLVKKKEEVVKCEVIPSSQAAIFFIHKEEDFINPCYNKEKYIKPYASPIPPIEGERHWPRTEFDLNPLAIKMGLGRRRKIRRKQPFEGSKRPGNPTKHGMEITYSSCKGKGQNKRGCPFPASGHFYHRNLLLKTRKRPKATHMV
ncbi:Replication protein E1 [Bienertia sinuspersici]